MKIWIDLTNSPHINFFTDMIRDLQKKHEFILTCRPLANTIELLDLFNFQYQIVGRHYGKNRSSKAFGFIVRVWQLYAFLRGKGINVAISHSSFYSPVVARLLKIRSIYLNDNEHALGNIISFRFADHVMVPEFLDPEKVQRQGAKPHKIVRYPGVKEGVYLWGYGGNEASKNLSGNFCGKGTVYVRPEPWTAQYYNGKRDFMDNLLTGLRDKFHVVLLPRGKAQESYYRHVRFAGITVPEKSARLKDIMASCDLFIGAGGTMTREAAVLGIPTISIYQDALLDVDRYLIENGFMIHNNDPDVQFIIDFFQRTARRPPERQLLEKGRQAYEMIKAELLKRDGSGMEGKSNA